jgi:hypothetical protein
MKERFDALRLLMQWLQEREDGEMIEHDPDFTMDGVQTNRLNDDDTDVVRACINYISPPGMLIRFTHFPTYTNWFIE